jgi:hypothetical protein
MGGFRINFTFYFVELMVMALTEDICKVHVMLLFAIGIENEAIWSV